MNAEVENHVLDLPFCSSAWNKVSSLGRMNREGFEFNNVCKGGDIESSFEMSNSSLNSIPIGREGLILSLRKCKSVGVNANVASALKLAFESYSVPRIDSESG